MTEIPKFSPGCFGSAITFKPDDMACRSCPFAAQCEPAHLAAVVALRERFGIQTTQEIVQERRRKREEAPVDPSALTLPKKTLELLARLDRGQFDIVGSLQRGENPFMNAFPFLRIACHLLLRMRQPLDRELLSTAFVRKFEWAENTADAHARLAIQALTHVGAVENTDGRISLKKAA